MTIKQLKYNLSLLLSMDNKVSKRIIKGNRRRCKKKMKQLSIEQQNERMRRKIREKN